MLTGRLALWQGGNGIKPVLTAASVGSSNTSRSCIAGTNIHSQLF